MASHRPLAIVLACIYAAASLYGWLRGRDHMQIILFAIGGFFAAYVAITK